MNAILRQWRLVLLLGLPVYARAQSADWQEMIRREPQVRYLLADMTLGGSVKLYRDYATKERDPDSREAIRLWEAGGRVINTNDFERCWVTNLLGKDGRVMRIVFRGTTRTITGNEVHEIHPVQPDEHDSPVVERLHVEWTKEHVVIVEIEKQIRIGVQER